MEIEFFAFRWKNYSSGKNVRRGKMFVGEKCSSGKNVRRGKMFVGEKCSSGKDVRRGKMFVGGKCSSGKNVRRGKMFVGENVRRENVRRGKMFVGKNVRRGICSSPHFSRRIFPTRYKQAEIPDIFRFFLTYFAHSPDIF